MIQLSSKRIYYRGVFIFIGALIGGLISKTNFFTSLEIFENLIIKRLKIEKNYTLWFIGGMKNEGSTNLNTKIEISNDFNQAGKPFKSRVDINVLKSKLEEEQSKELRKNIIIFSLCVVLLGSVGVYLSL